MSSPLPRVFIGSSAEGRDLARNLQAELGGAVEVRRWDQSVFEPSGNALDSLLATASEVDFAVLIATPDDTTVSRGQSQPSARDNIVLEFGLFAGALGRERTYLLASGEVRLPTDVLGLTRLSYRSRADDDLRAAVSEAALQIEQQVRRLGPLPRQMPLALPAGEAGVLDREIRLLTGNAVAQGWLVKVNSATTLRLRSPRGRSFTLPKRRTHDTRVQLRRFAHELRGAGLRVNDALRRPVEDSPFQA